MLRLILPYAQVAQAELRNAYLGSAKMVAAKEIQREADAGINS